ncbi:hypothetical protein niasHT_023897 [Heterodera trifolii]|uniref:Secreted protein n=1 Tax=Heterodera trifolii TaxID=157864 RepID=A0ABD2JCM7_9BILA
MVQIFNANISRLCVIFAACATMALANLAVHSDGTLLWAPAKQNEALMSLNDIWTSPVGTTQQKFALRQLHQTSPPFRPTAPFVFRFPPLGGTQRFIPADTQTPWADKRASLLARLANQSARGFGRK